ncbi:ph-response sensor protein [Didymella heteroderae]|uniref:Ph-response sensor protein n=1 Tax=Didymella heteroderae TaxID=1769908 RepID=A0A9P5BXX3_9PLEO|nr:ph-response sensor protein [Didymella heteroderae]
MTSSSKRDSVSSNSPAPSRSFLSRLKSPLTSKSRNFTDFYIQSDDPHRQYVPGDIISGTVIIKVVKPLRITHLVVSLHGYAQVFKNPNAPGDAYKNYSTTVGSGRGKKQGSYFGNGFVSLFEDEVVLCGEGKLAEGVYHFNFDLEFPSKGLPSSIDFERGTVCYMLTSTLTRPTTMSPTTTCDVKVTLRDVIDVAPIAEPKPRVISLEPISRRNRTKTPKPRPETAVTESVPPTPGGSTDTPRLAPPKSETGNGTPEETTNPRSPSPSETSFASQMSSSGASGTEYGIRSVNTVTDAGGFIAANGSRPTVKGKTITATIEVLKGGFLSGDQIPLRVTVNHNKHVRSLKGIIVTLYRQARVDMHPALPVAPNSKGDKTKSEEYYPKSRTGLGGLSLSSAGSSHTFRKDLGQSFAPLFVDPRTLMADIKCSVRVPDDVFPTISNVPGAMISFKYYVEVVVDIQGKLTGLDRMVSNAGVITVPTSTNSTPGGMGRDEAASNTFSTWGGTFVDTDGIRREKGVISSLFEVIVGTKDSERSGKRKQTQILPTNGHNGVHEIPYGSYDEANAYGEHDHYDYGYDENSQYYGDYGYDPAYYEVPGYSDNGADGGQSYHAPPVPAAEEGLSEKEQLRRAEALLLPSAPPGDADGPSTPAGAVQHGIPASAPVLPEDDDPNPSYPPEASSSSSAPSHPPPPFRAATESSLLYRAPLPPSTRRTTTENLTQSPATGSSLTVNTITQTPSAPPATSGTSNTNDAENHTKPLPPLPPQSPGAAPDYFPSSSHVQPTDDKQEMQRRRLEMESSAPPPAEDGENSQGPSAPPVNGGLAPRLLAGGQQGFRYQAPRHLAPSAPVLDEDDEELAAAIAPVRSRAERLVSEALPEYQR